MVLAFILPPLIGFFINALRFKSPNNKALSGIIGASACFFSFLMVVFYSLIYGFNSQNFVVGPWLHVGDLNLNFSFTLDALSLLMSLLITGVGSLIHLYSVEYMAKESGVTRYFAYLNLFIFMMLILVLADNLPLLFVGWEGVGLCSYLLIGFWFNDPKKVQAGQTAFVVNRIGDACFILGIFLLFSHFGTVHFSELNALFAGENSKNFPALLAALLLFLGATGKSAQLPLYFWLPGAMAGPTPVSALIHAATMVTAGVYMIIRLSFFYSAFPDLLVVISWIGAITALGAALIAARQWDIKKVLAYSTISQLAYLFMALGIQAFSASLFHLITHGFFKALLFLCAGSVIHAMNGEQDIRFMGGLKKTMPITFFTYLIGALALMAIPPFSGFFSKDEILWSLFASQNYALWAVAFLTGLCTVFYMTKLTIFTFLKPAYKTNHTPHESGWLMTSPLIALAILSSLGGLLGIPHFVSEIFHLPVPHLLHDLLKDISPLYFKGALWKEVLLMTLSVGLGGGLIFLTGFYYLRYQKESQPAGWKTLLEQAFFVNRLISLIQTVFAKSSFQVVKHIEKNVFEQGILWMTNQIFKIRTCFTFLQNGNIQSYALYIAMGVSVFMALIFFR